MKSERIKALITWFLLVIMILITLGTIKEVKDCNDGKLVKGLFWWECIKDE